MKPVQQEGPIDANSTDRRQRASAVDLWIRRELQRSYDQTLAEPVPEALLRLLNCFPAHP
jgi:hypothetical protein